jgi:ankyrin repeat protein
MLRVPREVTMTKALWALLLFLCLGCPARSQDLNTKLTDAARSRDTAEVRKLLEDGANPNAKDKNGRTPLMEASSGGYTDTVRVLLEKGADVNATDMVGWSALFWAAFSRRTETLRTLVAKGADVNLKDNEGRTALIWAASSGYTDTVRALLEKGASVNAKDSHGWTALMNAADLGQKETVRALLERGADVRVRGNDGSTAQSLAEKYKYSDIVALLKHATREPADKGPSDANASKPAGDSANSSGTRLPPSGSKRPPTSGNPVNPLPTNAQSKSELLNQKLLKAAGAGDTAEVLSLIREGAGVNARGATYGNTALMDAAARGYTDTVRALLDKGGDVDATDNAGRTALMEAAFGGYTETVRLLVEKGANVNAHDNEGWSPLFWAAFSRRTECVRFLLDKGADVNTKNKHEDTSLIHAAYGGDVDTVTVLIERHADLNLKDDMGRTALIEAARQGHTDVVRLLLENGAATDVQASDGSTAMSLALKQHYSEIVDLIKNPPQKPEPKPPVVPQTGVTDSPPGTATPATADSLAAATQALEKKTKARVFFRLGLSMRLIEELWPQPGRVAERAATSIVGDLRKVGGPEDISELAQVTSNRLAYSPEDRKVPAPPLIGDLRKRLDTYCMSQPDQQFFYAVGGFTYDLNLLGQDLNKSELADAAIEVLRRNDLALITNFSSQCAAIPECKDVALSYFADAALLLQKSPLLPADGTKLLKLSDDIGVALGTDDH